MFIVTHRSRGNFRRFTNFKQAESLFKLLAASVPKGKIEILYYVPRAGFVKIKQS